MKLWLPRLMLLTAFALVAACSNDAPTGGLDATAPASDATGPTDGAPGADLDSGPPEAGSPDNGTPDTGTSTASDGGPIEDAGTSTSSDAGPAPDGGQDIDAGPAPDGGAPDSGLPEDLGEACAAANQCSTGFCFQRVGQDVCSLCAVNGDCGVQQDCEYDGALGYATCVGSGDLGDSCNTDDQCQSNHCNAGVCSECEVDLDCEGGGTCIDDRSGEGYFSCTGGLGDPCQAAPDCGSGFCYDPPGGGPNRCSECAVNGDCGPQRECSFDFGDDYATCVGTGDLGDICNAANQCASGFCQGGVCSECSVTADCPGGGSCEDDTGGAGYWVCTGGLGDPCAGPSDCNSGFCYDLPVGTDRCSECAVSQDCPNNGACIPDLQVGYARCF